MILSRILLLPYWITLKIRHHLYDSGRWKSESYLTRVISVGNVTVGGTGKTPMVECIIRMLGRGPRIAVLSRGYKGSNRDFHVVKETDSALLVGDEPLQIKRKFPRITVAVDPDRTRGVRSLQMLVDAPDVIILDDGFQRRDIIPDKNILLVDYNRPIFSDELLPLGRLRDLPEQIKRADAVVFTKCPGFLFDEERERARTLARVKENQQVFFASIGYSAPKAVFKGIGNTRYIYAKEVIAFTGVANPKPMLDELSKKYTVTGKWLLPDHHAFTRSEMEELTRFATRHPLSIIMTTEKDAQRLLDTPWLPEEIKARLFYLPIETEFITEEEAESFVNFLKS